MRAHTVRRSQQHLLAFLDDCTTVLTRFHSLVATVPMRADLTPVPEALRLDPSAGQVEATALIRQELLDLCGSFRPFLNHDGTRNEPEFTALTNRLAALFTLERVGTEADESAWRHRFVAETLDAFQALRRFVIEHRGCLSVLDHGPAEPEPDPHSDRVGVPGHPELLPWV